MASQAGTPSQALRKSSGQKLLGRIIVASQVGWMTNGKSAWLSVPADKCRRATITSVQYTAVLPVRL